MMEGQANSFLPKVGVNTFTNFIAPTGQNTQLRNDERIFRSNIEKRAPRAVGGYGEKDSDIDMRQMEEKYQRLKKMIQKDDDDEEDWRMSEF